MHFFSFLAAFLLVNRVRRALKNSPLYPKWKTLLTVALWSVIGIFCIAEGSFESIANDLIGSFLLLGVLLFAEREPDFKPFRSVLRAHYPLVAAVLISGLTEWGAPAFHERWDNYFDFAIIGAFIWIFARWASSKKQLEELKIVTAQNQQLDRLVAERTAELTRQKDELQETLVLLQTTQQQLIQSEKLASLGELTAGIAHEIQNPLNFVNNFSEVSIELIDEMEHELINGDKAEAVAVAADIRQNLEKIIHHGKRADGIVKGMLQHSRAGNDVKEPTDLNKLADEYLRLAFHGLRAKDKSFNAELITHFDPSLPGVSVVPQDVGRVLLNLFNNAFYAVQQKQKTAPPGYKPEVTVTTGHSDNAVEITVEDNGPGVPELIKDKIMQPFFTTKPTGEGTGLGLSLSYDIIVKGHGGKIDVDSRDGEFTVFKILLPA